jgi:hypothetical protein
MAAGGGDEAEGGEGSGSEGGSGSEEEGQRPSQQLVVLAASDGEGQGRGEVDPGQQAREQDHGEGSPSEGTPVGGTVVAGAAAETSGPSTCGGGMGRKRGASVWREAGEGVVDGGDEDVGGAEAGKGGEAMAMVAATRSGRSVKQKRVFDL